MSGLVTSLAGGAAFTALTQGPEALTYIGDALITPFRAIGTIIPNVLIEEVNRDDLEITQHPVEYNSPITDHSFKRPMEVVLRVGWSNSGNYHEYILDTYDALLDLQASRTPFDVYTGKRHYTNMLMASLIQTSNGSSGDFALMIQAMLREVIIVSTQAATVPASALGSQTSNFSGVTNASPQGISTATNNSLNTQSSSFNGVQAMALPSSSALPTNLTVVPFVGAGGA